MRGVDGQDDAVNGLGGGRRVGLVADKRSVDAWARRWRPLVENMARRACDACQPASLPVSSVRTSSSLPASPATASRTGGPHRTHFVANTRWWPPFCMAVDWVVAAIIVVEIAAGVKFR